MKIALLVSTFYPKIGGMGEVVLQEARGLKKLGHEVVVFTMAYKGQKAGEDDVGGVKVIRISPRLALGDGGWLPDFHKMLDDFDIVHLHYPFYGGTRSVISAKKKLNKKVVLSYHMDAVPSGAVKTLFKFIYDFVFVRQVFRLADKIAVVDRDSQTLNLLDKKGVQEKICYLPNGIDVEQFFYSPPREKIDKKNLLFVGNPLPIKGLSVLLEAMKLADDSYRLTVVGGGYGLADYRKEAENLGISDKVKFIGSVSKKDELIKFFHQADCVIVPSIKESFSLVALESFACGTPVILSDIPGLRGRVDPGQDGLLFKVNDPKDLLVKLAELFALSYDERLSLSKRARTKAEEDYSLKNHLENLVNIYNDVL